MLHRRNSSRPVPEDSLAAALEEGRFLCVSPAAESASNAADPGGTTNHLGYNAGSSRRIPDGVMTIASSAPTKCL